MNEYQNYTGWVEVYNDSNTPVNIRGYIFENHYVKSGVINTHRWTVTANITIPAYGYELFFFDEEPGDKHATYKIETVPETDRNSLILLDNARRKVSELNYKKMFPHVSWGRCEDEDEGYMLKPTPKAANEICLSKESKRVQKPAFGRSPGFYTSSVSVSLQSEPGAAIYYTTNGSEPTEQSTRYSNPVTVSRTTVIRARAYMENTVMSEIATGTFIFNSDSKGDNYHSQCGGFTVPVISISTAPDNFFGNQFGIYVVGTNGKPGGCDQIVANYYQDWKRPVNFEYFVNNKQVISQELDAGIMGGCSRDHTQKSLKLTASKKSGNNKIPYDFFPVKQGNEYKSLQLRNGGNDNPSTLIRDGFMQTLTQGMMNIDYQAYQPVAFYINGEYWGLISMMERTNKDFVYSNYGLSEEDIDLLKIGGGWPNPRTGDADAYYYLLEQAKTGTSSPGYYEKMNRLMDMDEYIDYQIFEQYIGNTDWPGNNIKAWREKTNGRFRWIVYDTDFGFGIYGDPQFQPSFNMLDFSLGQGWYKNWANEEKAVELFSNLMKNETFRQKFLNKFILHLGTTFTPLRVEKIRDSIYTEVAAEACAHRKKFPGWGDNRQHIPMSSSFGNERAGYVYDHLRTYFGLGNPVNLTISANNISNADFIVNGERLNTSGYSGKYFRNKTLEVQPIAPAGYKFSSWNLISSSSNATPILNANTVWRYYYNWGLLEENWYTWYKNSFNDATWSSGRGKFGYDTNNIRTYDVTLNYGDINDKYRTAYFRTSFNISDLSAIDELLCKIMYDDGVVIYLNGQEVKRFNMPAGPVYWWVFAVEVVNDVEASFTIDKSYLQAGQNVMAVEVHQVNATSSDLTFKLDLEGKKYNKIPAGGAPIYSTTVTGDLSLEAVFEKCDYVKPALFINELCASNNSNSGFHDEYGVYADWIEIYNAGDAAVDLAGMYLTEERKGVTYQFPSNAPFETTIPPGGHKIVWADKAMWQGPLHANFKLTAEVASTLILSQMVEGQKVEIDRVSYPNEVGKNKNESYGRVTDGAFQWTIFAYHPEKNIYLATPGAANGSKLTSVEDVISGSGSIFMKLYPNPAKTTLNIVVNTSNSYSIRVYDDKGRSIEYMPAVNENVTTLNLQGYNSGVYIVKVVTEEVVLQEKFVKY